MDDLKSKKILHFAVRAGEVMLKSGAETYRVEDTISRILHSHNFETVETFVVPTCIIATIDDYNIELATKVKRIKNRSTRLDKIAAINSLSRDYVAGKISLIDARKKVDKVDKMPTYSLKTVTLATGISAGFFTIMLGGGPIDFIPSFIIGIFLSLINHLLTKRDVVNYLIYFISGFVIGACAMTSYWAIPGVDLDSLIIGSIMPLVPGVAFTNAIRDMIGDELVSALSRGVEALFIAICIAAGTGIAMNIFSSLGGGLL